MIESNRTSHGERREARDDDLAAAHSRFSRGAALGLGAATALAGGLTSVERAFAAWSATLPRSLKGTITFQAYLYESGQNVAGGRVPTQMYKKYLAMHPGVRLEMVPVPASSVDVNAWMVTRAIANRLPDLTQNGRWAYIRQGFETSITKYLHEPNPYIPGNKRWIDSLPKDFLKPFVGLDGNYYAFCADTSAIWIYYNPEHLQRIGMKPPATWAEMMAACAKLQAKGITPYSQAGGLGWPISWWFLFTESSLWASEFPPGTSLDVAGWVKAVKKGLLKRSDARTREAWQMVKDFGKYWQRGAISGAGNKLYSDFANGKVTFMQDGSWQITTLQGLLKGRFPLVALPAGFPPVTTATSRFANGSLQASGAAALNGIALWVTNHAKDHLDLVVDFLRYFGSPRVIGPMALEVGEVPVVEGVSHLPPLIAQAKSVATQPGLLMTPYYNADPKLTTTYDKMAQGYLAGALSLDAALSALESVQQDTATKLAGLMGL